MGNFDEKVEQVITIVNESINELGIIGVSVLFEKSKAEYDFIFYKKEDGIELGGYAVQKSFFEREDVSAEELADGVMHALEVLR